MTSRRLLRGFLLAILASLPTAGFAHTNPYGISLEVVLREDKLVIDVHISVDMFREIVEDDSPDLTSLSAEKRKLLLERLEPVMVRQNPVTVAGERLSAQVDFRQVDQGRATPDIVVTLSYPLEARPTQISIVWNTYGEEFAPDDLDEKYRTPEIEEAPAAIKIFTEPIALEIFSLDEPEYIWHAGATRSSPGVSPVLAPQSTRDFPFLAFGILSLLLLILAAFSALSHSATPGTRKLVLTFALYMGLFGVAFRNQLPWTLRAPLPADSELQEVFKSLLENIYRSFDAGEENQIFDTLSHSVAGPILTQIYDEVFRSLVMRDEGGPVSTVRAVEVLETSISRESRLPDFKLSFRAEATWQVDGYVRHWGHVHSRVNEYRAIYGLAKISDTWKIVEQTPLSQKQISKSSRSLENKNGNGKVDSRKTGDGE